MMATRSRKSSAEPPAQPVKERGARTPAKNGNGDFRAKVRMYRQGLGDCFLITLPRRAGKAFYMMIDCGVILGTEKPGQIMTRVVQDIIATPGGRIDVLVATHEHWDHLSGFVQATEDFRKLQVGEVWLAWTEDPKDALAQNLRSERQALQAALAVSATRMRLAGRSESADEVTGMLEFFGAAGSGSTADALEVVKGLSSNVRFCRPTDPPVPLDGVDARVFVLGPPHDEKLIKKYDPSKSQPETYGIDAMNLFMASMAPALAGSDSGAPFDTLVQIPSEAAKQMSFFQTRYWGEDPDSAEKDQGWRRIDNSWLDSSSSLALQLDSATNNTSLVLAIELKDGDVLLFVADAQVGNWLSWQSLSWTVGDEKVTGPELLRRTIFYKVGHHGSHNATLREQGLEMMSGLKLAMIPVNHEMALKKRWGNMPLPELTDRLNQITSGRLLRMDADVPQALTGRVSATDLFYETAL
jgi:hypothetical protein